MNKTVINIVILLGLATVAFAGYFMFTQQSATELTIGDKEQLQTMLANTRVFIERREILDKVQINIGLFEDPRFNTLQSFTTEIKTSPVRESNPFTDTRSSTY